MTNKLFALGLATALLISLSGCQSGTGASSEDSASQQGLNSKAQTLVLSDQAVTLDGQAVTEGTEGAVTLSHDIIYYQDGTDESYGEGTEADMHTKEEASRHAVVTIAQPGTYRVSGSLSAGQLAVDLGEEAKTDPEAVVTLILDGVDITCTVAPAVIFYNVYECNQAWVAYSEEEAETYDPSPVVDTSAAGANVILADGSVNSISGSYVARIYKEGTDKKLHKYDGAFYSKMSMNVTGGTDGTGVLNITAENEGLNSEVHLTINGGAINIQADNDGINTNEDGVSVTTINGGTLQINAGLGIEGDAIDSNGHLVINGGNVYTMANERSPDGGIDADGEILLNGGYLVALGVRNDAASSQSAQLYMELAFAATLPSGTAVELSGPDGNPLLSFTTQKACQAITFSSPDLETDLSYTLRVDGVVQQYAGNQAGGLGGPMGGGMGGQLPMGDYQPGEGQEMPEPPEGMHPSQRPEVDFGPGQRPEWIQPPQRPEDGDIPEMPDGIEPPQGVDPGAMGPGGMGGAAAAGEGSVEFTLTDTVRSFSGITDSARDSGKAAVAFSTRVEVDEEGAVSVSDILASQEVEQAHVQLSVADVPSEDYAAACLWSDGEEAIQAILPEDPGTYRLTIAVTGDSRYTGSSQFTFTIPE